MGTTKSSVARLKPMVTIGEVAREAGVSITTVSHVFSGKRSVALDTTERVHSAAQRLRYKPSRMAQGLATGRTMTIGIQFSFEADSLVLDPYTPKLFEGMSAAAVELGYGFVLLPTSTAGPGSAIADLLRQRRFDGAVVVDPWRNNSVIPQLLHHSVPVVTTGRYRDGSAIPWIDHDNQGGMKSLIRHLREQGYERPALISVRGGLSYATDVEEAFAEAAAGPVVQVAAISEEEGYRAAIRLLRRRHRPDAIVNAGDRQAVGVLRAARELGLDVPVSLGVAGAGDSVLASHSHPRLTSIHVSAVKLGELVVRRLVSILDGVDEEEESGGSAVPTEVIVRASTDRGAEAG